jgi:uncharacterized protein (TIGR03435 family)
MARAILIALLFAAVTLSAQEREGRSPIVEVASVKENKSRDTAAARLPGGPGRFGAINMTLRGLINFAYGGIPPSRILGGPDWADSIRFDVAGIGDPTPSEMNLLQAVLRDRFALKLRPKSRQFDVYSLVLARPDGKLGPGLRTNSDCTEEARKKLLRLKPREPACGTIQISDGRMNGKGIQLSRLGGYLRSGRPVFDRTGLQGYVDIVLEWVPAPTDDGPSLFTAVQDQLGLKLEPTKAPLDVLVIEHAERPTQN